MANSKPIDQFAPIIRNLTRSELAGDASLESKQEIAREPFHSLTLNRDCDGIYGHLVGHSESLFGLSDC